MFGLPCASEGSSSGVIASDATAGPPRRTSPGAPMTPRAGDGACATLGDHRAGGDARERVSDVIEKTETGSTNDDAKQLAAAGAPHLTVVWAHRQVMGRGRHDRAWASPEGNLYWSVIIRPQPGWPPAANLVYVNALAVLTTLAAATGPEAA